MKFSDSTFWDIQLLSNRYIALAVMHIRLSEYIERQTNYTPKQHIGDLIQYCCPLCQKGNCDIYVDNAKRNYFTTKCGKKGDIFDLKITLEHKSKEVIANDLERQGKLLDKNSFLLTKPKYQDSQRRFRIGLSFADEYRDTIISKIADGLLQYFARDEILYDKFHEEEFSVYDLDEKLWQLFNKECDLIAIFLCKEYQKKPWCRNEFRSIKDLLNKSGDRDRLFLFRLDDTEILGTSKTTDGYLYITESDCDIQRAIMLIKQRYERIFSKKLMDCNQI